MSLKTESIRTVATFTGAVMEGEKPVEYYFYCFVSILSCFMLSVVYVASLYVWKASVTLGRDHPTTIKKRFFSVFIMMFISPLFLYFFSNDHTLKKVSLWTLLGLRMPGIIPASILPLLLTMLLFLGPLSMQWFSGVWKLYAEPRHWLSNVKNLCWLRNHVVAPLSEEFTFRACMVPLLLQCFRPMNAVFICPLFFGVAHFHHTVERIRGGLDLNSALLISCFQFAYTTLFGAYSAFLFMRTGHFIAPFLAHVFCNHMGFPDFSEVLTYKEPQRYILMALYVLGVILWLCLLTPLTNPAWYSNELFWKNRDF